MGFDIHSFLQDVVAGKEIPIDDQKRATPIKGEFSDEVKGLILDTLERNKKNLCDEDLANLMALRNKIVETSSGKTAVFTKQIDLLFKEKFGFNSQTLERDLLIKRFTMAVANASSDEGVLQLWEEIKGELRNQVNERSIAEVWGAIRDFLPASQRNSILRDLCSFVSGDLWDWAKEALKNATDNVRKDFVIESFQKDSLVTLYFFGNFGITDQAVLIEIAKLCAQKDGWGTAEYIKNFGIVDQDVLIEIAKLCAQEDGRGTAYGIKNFGIKEQAVLIEIAKLCAQNDVRGTAEFIENFGIEDEGVLIEIAKLCAQNDGIGTAFHIKNFGIKDEGGLIEIAKLCAQNNGGVTAEFIENFGIEDEGARIEIAKLCAQNNGRVTAEFIENFGIKDAEPKRQILFLAIAEDPKSITFWSKAGLEGAEGLPDLFRDPFVIEDALPTIEAYLEKHLSKNESFKSLLRNIGSQTLRKSDLEGLSEHEKAEKLRELEYKKEKQLRWLGAAVFLLRQSADDEQVAWVEQQGLLKVLSEVPNSDLRWFYSAALSRMIPNKQIQNAWESLPVPQGMQKSTLFKLTRLFCSQLVVEGVSKDGVLELLKVVGNRKASLFQDTRKLQHLTEGLCRFAQDKNLSAEEKTSVLKRLLKSEIDKSLEDIVKEYGDLLKTNKSVDECLEKIPCDRKKLRGIKTRLSSLKTNENKEKKLREELWQLPVVPSTKEEQLQLYVQCLNSLYLFGDTEMLKDQALGFEQALEKSFRSKVPVGDVENFVEKYYRSFGSSRNSMAIMRYASKVASLNNEQARQCLGKYVTSVLEGNFGEVRNRLEGNSHLRRINDYDPKFLEKWQQSDSVPLEAFDLSPGTTQFSAEGWLKQKLLVDKHLGDFATLCPNLHKYLSTASDEERKNIRQSMIEGLKQAGVEQARFQFENTCMQIVTAKTVPDRMGQLKKLEEWLRKEPFNSPEFLNDVTGLQTELSKQKGGKYVVVDSEDYMDLLLAGTEVEGSCQRIDGDPSLNRGLLGYLMDGKNRLLAVKADGGPEGRIEARCLLRLLWDGERPVLLRERLYPVPIDSEFEQALNALAEKKAKVLGVPLVSQDGRGKPYPKSLQALGGPAPFEYVDAAGGVQQNGFYMVSGVSLVSAA